MTLPALVGWLAVNRQQSDMTAALLECIDRIGKEEE